MEYIEGTPLQEFYQRLNLEEKVSVIAKIANALKEAHRNGIVHRDIKPSNIMVVKKGDGTLKPYLLDFGIARAPESKDKTMTGSIIGSPGYMSPEQAFGEVHKIDRRSDIYSLGATLYFLLCGRPPFEGDNLATLIYKAMNEDPLPPSRFNKSIPSDLEAIVLKCLEKEPARRYQSAKEFEEDLIRYLEGEPVKARVPSLSYRIYKKIKKNKAFYSLLAISTLIVVFILGFYISNIIHEKERRKLALEFGRMAEDIANKMIIAYLLPPHNIEEEKKQIKKKIESLKKKTERLEKDEAGIGYFAIGKAYYYLEEEKSSIKYLEMAHKTYRNEDLKRFLILLYLKRYADLYRQYNKYSDNVLKKEKLKEIEVRYLNKAKNLIKEVKGDWPEGDNFKKGILAFIKRDYKSAAGFFEKTCVDNPSFYRSYLYAGMCYGHLYDNNPDKRDF